MSVLIDLIFILTCPVINFALVDFGFQIYQRHQFCMHRRVYSNIKFYNWVNPFVSAASNSPVFILLSLMQVRVLCEKAKEILMEESNVQVTFIYLANLLFISRSLWLLYFKIFDIRIHVCYTSLRHNGRKPSEWNGSEEILVKSWNRRFLPLPFLLYSLISCTQLDLSPFTGFNW